MHINIYSDEHYKIVFISIHTNRWQFVVFIYEI